MGEMLTRRPLLPSRDTMEQMKLIIDLLGPPSSTDTSYLPKEAKNNIDKLKNEPARKESRLNRRFSFAPESARDLLTKLLTFNPEKRITAAEALAHPFLVDLHLEEDEPAGEPVSRLEFEFMSLSLTTEQIKGTSNLTQTCSTSKRCGTISLISRNPMRRRKEAERVSSATSSATRIRKK
jgi:serine/threonine protein kinase